MANNIEVTEIGRRERGRGRKELVGKDEWMGKRRRGEETVEVKRRRRGRSK